MATIALPRSPAPRQGGPLHVVSSARSSNHPKQIVLDTLKHSVAHTSSPHLRNHLSKPAASLSQKNTYQDNYDDHCPVSAKQDQILAPIIDKMASPSSNTQFADPAPSTPL